VINTRFFGLLIWRSSYRNDLVSELQAHTQLIAAVAVSITFTIHVTQTDSNRIVHVVIHAEGGLLAIDFIQPNIAKVTVTFLKTRHQFPRTSLNRLHTLEYAVGVWAMPTIQ